MTTTPTFDRQRIPANPRKSLEGYFDDFRAARRERYAKVRPNPAKSRAALTIVQNEPLFLPIWLDYYSRFFAPEDLYVIDHQTTDGSTSGDGFVRIPVEHDTVDHVWMVETVQAHQHRLLDSYDVVLTTDVDEIVAPRPSLGTLTSYIDWLDEEWVNCIGFEVVHRRDREPPLDLARPVLDQRSYWIPNDGYNKAALATEPMVWKPGFHGRADNQTNIDPDLYMIHLHRMDYDLCRERHRARSLRRWNERDESEGWAVHNRLADGEEFDHWFESDSGFVGIPMAFERIPSEWRGLV